MIIKDNKSRIEAKDKKFRICDNKGFHITFENGWTVSVQFGWGNYSDNYNAPVENMRLYGKFPYASDTAEVWAWNDKKHYPENNPLAYQTPKEVLKFINKIARRKKMMIWEISNIIAATYSFVGLVIIELPGMYFALGFALAGLVMMSMERIYKK